MTAILALLAPLLDRVLGHVLPDPAERQRTILEALGKLTEADLAQLTVNRAEAASPSLFVAGWRPAIGWCCATALFYQYLFVPLSGWLVGLAGVTVAAPPSLDGQLFELMLGMLGMGALRTVEKLKGVAGSGPGFR